MRIKKKFQGATVALLLSTLFSMVGCSSIAENPDPYEGYNRKIYKFNRFVDKAVYRPVAQGYDFIMPTFARYGVTNFFNNVYQVPTMANDVLQLNMPWFASDFARLILNTTIGLGGLFDPATRLGVPHHSQDFGLTLARWGMKQSPYFLVPLLPAPTTFRDALSLGVDYIVFYPFTYVRPWWIGTSAWALNFIDKRAAALPTDKLVDEAFDPYIFVRDAYLQNRQAKVQAVRNPKGSGVVGENAPDLLPVSVIGAPLDEDKGASEDVAGAPAAASAKPTATNSQPRNSGAQDADPAFY